MTKIILGSFIGVILAVIFLIILVFLIDGYERFRVKWAKRIGEKFNEIH